MWHVLLPRPADCEDASSRFLIAKNLIIRIEYGGPPSGYRGVLGRFLDQFGQILIASSDDLNEGDSFDIILDQKVFIPAIKMFQKMPLIVIGRKPTCWKCWETVHLYYSCPEKKASEDLSPAVRVCYFRLACDGYANDWDRCDETPGWV